MNGVQESTWVVLHLMVVFEISTFEFDAVIPVSAAFGLPEKSNVIPRRDNVAALLKSDINSSEEFTSVVDVRIGDGRARETIESGLVSVCVDGQS